MKKVMLFLIFIIVSCKEEQKENIVIAPQSIESPDIINYVFITIKTEEPNLIYSEPRTVPSGITTNTVDGFPQTTYERMPEFSNVKWIENMHLSNIIEVRNLTEDYKYKLMDDFEDKLASELDLPYQNQVCSKVMDLSKRELLLKNKTTKKGRNVSVFDSYKKASENREVLSEIWRRSVEHQLTGKSMNIEYNN